MVKARALISPDIKIVTVPRPKRVRIWEIDFLRGLCVLLMVLDHLAIFLGDYFGPAWFGSGMLGDSAGAAFCRWCRWFSSESLAREILHPAVLFVFFSISGISCSFSRSNFRRGALLAVFAMIYTGLSYAAEDLFGLSGIRVNFGVLHFYAACILAYALIDFICRGNAVAKMAISAAIVAVVLSVYFLYTPPADTPIWLAPVFPYEDFWGNPSLFYTHGDFSPGDLFTLIPWSSFFFFGTAVAPLLYPRRRSLMPFLDRGWHRPVGFVGKYALIVYFAHIVVIPVVLMLISFLFMTPGSWGLF